mmetsp:Transcript_29614/g.45728  ORF Transcript_29614/g.45728 Transcript_29614/m.45728 type:complete len:225 (+) Transcript_29614:891-1565(+)
MCERGREGGEGVARLTVQEQGDLAGAVPLVSVVAVSVAVPARAPDKDVDGTDPGRPVPRQVLLQEGIHGHVGPHGAVRRPLLLRVVVVFVVVAAARSVAAASLQVRQGLRQRPAGGRRRRRRVRPAEETGQTHDQFVGIFDRVVVGCGGAAPAVVRGGSAVAFFGVEEGAEVEHMQGLHEVDLVVGERAVGIGRWARCRTGDHSSGGRERIHRHYYREGSIGER